MLQQLQSLLQPGEEQQAQELQAILSELTWDQERRCYIGSRSAVAGITGLASSAIEQGLRLGNSQPTEHPRLLPWLAAAGVPTIDIQREWQAGVISEQHIVKLITYAATEADTRTPEARRWLNLLTGVGLRAGFHQMTGRGCLLNRATINSNNRRLAQQDIHAKLIKGVTTKAPQQLTDAAKEQGTDAEGDWRNHVDATTLAAVSMAENGYSITGDEGIGVEIRELLMRNGWSGEVERGQQLPPANTTPAS